MTANRSLQVTGVTVHDVRYPTSDNMKGSDPFHKKPDYSGAYLSLATNDPNITGISLVFMIGAGTDWVCHGIKDLAQLLVGLDIKQFISDPGAVHRRLVDHHQLRWLGSAGMFQMVVGSLMNALWDLAAKAEKKPMWLFLSELPAETIVKSVNWRFLRDALTPEEALLILQRNESARATRIAEFSSQGPQAYSTAGWSGLSDDQLREACRIAVDERGMRSLKAKVGIDLAEDRRRLRLMRDAVGDQIALRVDANQIWGVQEAIDWMLQLTEFNLLWIEEPTSPDDIVGYHRIKEALKPYGIGVAGGEHTANPVMFKQLLQSGALDFCQIDATRTSGPSDVFAAILLAAKFGVPVCPHGGGIGLCNYIQHYGAWDQICVTPNQPGRVVEWIDFLDEAMVSPVQVVNGHYVLQQIPGWGAELKPEFVERYSYPDGPIWKERPDDKKGVIFEA